MSTGKQQSLMRLAVLLGIESVCIVGAFLVAVYLTDLGMGETFGEKAWVCIPYLVIFLALWTASSLSKGELGTVGDEDLGSYAAHVTKAVADGLIVCVVVMGLFSAHGVIRQFLVAFGVGVFAIIVGLRTVARFGLWGARLRGLNSHRTLIVGANVRSEALLRTLASREHLGYRILGVLDDDETRGRKLATTYDVAYLGTTDDFDAVVETHKPDDVFVSLPIRSFYGRIQEIAERCERDDIAIRLVADLFPLRIATNRLMYVEDIPLLSLSTVPEEQLRLALKRAVDLFVSSILLVVLAIPFLIVAIVIKLDSPGPVFFAQERVGQNQRRFKMLKFRSMVTNAEALRRELEAQNEADGPVFKMKKDPRVTRVGGFIRKYSIDEFPQLINVWLGQMSLVGPRPPIASEVEQYSWEQRRRLSVKPGMTGLWQVSGRSDVAFNEWVALDLQYIDSWSLSSDFVILLKTFRAVVQGRGAA